jgi:hypothetical protein
LTCICVHSFFFQHPSLPAPFAILLKYLVIFCSPHMARSLKSVCFKISCNLSICITFFPTFHHSKSISSDFLNYVTDLIEFIYFLIRILVSVASLVKVVCVTMCYTSCNTSVSKLTGCGLNSQGLVPGRGRDFPVCLHNQIESGTLPASYLVGTRSCYLKVELLVCEIDHTHYILVMLRTAYLPMAWCVSAIWSSLVFVSHYYFVQNHYCMI